ncbi:MAG: AtpZ/AtpI family protein [Pseudobutyrivibrio sp.]|nr:AtpZ/AtpI family protein [Pseudobutyrivibrio sp.]
MKDKNKQVANSLVLVLQFGINVIVPIMLCTMLGVLLANHFGSKSYSIIGILVGIVAGFNGAFRMVKGYLKNPESPGQRARRLEEEEKNSHNENDN